jgi:hypothetical protein
MSGRGFFDRVVLFGTWFGIKSPPGLAATVKYRFSPDIKNPWVLKKGPRGIFFYKTARIFCYDIRYGSVSVAPRPL